MNADANKVANYVLRELKSRHPEQRRLWNLNHIADLPENFSLKGVAGDSRSGLLGWLKDLYPLILIDHIPTPFEMLNIQCDGQRFVSYLTAPEFQKPLGRHAGPYEFLLHDLEHAHKFFGDPECHLGQVRFFLKIRQALNQGFFHKQLQDAQFEREFHYLISDMNSHPVHLLKYLKAIVLNAGIREHNTRDVDLSLYWGELFSFWKMSQNETVAALKINQPEAETSDAQKTVAAFFFSRPKGALLERFCP